MFNSKMTPVLDDAEIDIGEAALVLSKEAAPLLVETFNIRTYSDILTKLAVELRDLVGEIDNPERVIRQINGYLFGTKSFDVNGTDFLPELLEAKKGSCAALSVLYLAVTAPLSLPLYCVYLPGHLIVRWDERKYKRNIDTTVKGVEFSDSYYISKFKLSQVAVARGIYLHNLSKREIIAVLLMNRGSRYAGKRLYRQALSDYDLSLRLNPTLAEAHYDLGNVYLNQNRLDMAIAEYEQALSLNPEYVEASKAKELANMFKRSVR